MNKPKRREAPRREIEPLMVSSIVSLDNMLKLGKGGSIVEASITGFKMFIAREDLVPQSLRKNLTLENLVGAKVMIHISQMNLEISGIITRTRLAGNKSFELGIDFSDDAPEYWRECLMDLLPSPGELETH